MVVPLVYFVGLFGRLKPLFIFGGFTRR